MVAALLLAVTVSCGSGTTTATEPTTGLTASTGPLPTPTGPGACGKASDPGSPDGGVLAGVQWPSGTYALGAAAEVFVCLGRFVGSTVRLTQTGAGVQLNPTQVVLPASSNGVLSMHVTAATAGTTRLRLVIVDRNGKSQVDRPGPQVLADATGWHFAPGA